MQQQDIETDLSRAHPDRLRLNEDADPELEAWLASPNWPPSTAPAVDDDDYLIFNT
jgi:hypothetical protein